MSGFLPPTEYDCQTTVWGRICVTNPKGEAVELYVHECEILALQPNLKKQIFEREKKGNTAT
jgi:hypothetical protein